MTDPERSAQEPGGSTPIEAGEAWHALSVADALSRLGVTAGGLSSAEVAERLARHGPNALQPPGQVSAWTIFLSQFRSVVMLLLLAAAAISFIAGDPVDAAAIFAVLLINALVGFITELKARGAMAALLRMQVPHATVIRDGRETEIEAVQLVPGDLVVIEAGQAVPADARLVSSVELRVNEAPLTGESLPVAKRADAVLPADTPLADRVNRIFMSTAVVAGSARAVVVATGMHTELGHIGGLVGEIQEERTPLEERLDALGRRLVWLVLAITVVVVALGLLRGEAFAMMLETGLALAIAAVPEGLPAVSTVALAVGVARMAKRNALVRRLPAVEALGSATIVCTDKTGTLTAGEMTVTRLWTAAGEYRVTGAGYNAGGAIEAAEADRSDGPGQDPALPLALRVGVLNNRAALLPRETGWTIRGDPTEAALLVLAEKGGLDRQAVHDRWPEVAELPFSSERMMMATFHHGDEGAVLYVKGAPGRVLERSVRILTADGDVPLQGELRDRVLTQNREMAARGLRVLGLAQGRGDLSGEDALHDLTLIGFVGISDPPAAGVQETIQRFHAAGIRTVMITGDQRLTAEAVARDLGILAEGTEVVEGKELETLDGAQLDERLPRVSAFSRVSPRDKLRIVEGFQRRGQIVAMLGDGVNDAAALKKADIGVAMGIRGTDVAKEAASVVLQDDRFMTIGAAVEEGRVIFDNIRKFVFYLFSCNLAEVFVILVAGLIGLPQPLLPLQILWLNLVTDTFPALSLAMEPAQRNVMLRPPRDPAEAILSAPFLRAITLYALLITGVTLGAFLWALQGPGGEARAVTVAFMTLALAQTFHLGNARDSAPVLRLERIFSNPWAIAAVILTVSLQLAAVYVAPLAAILGVTPLAAREWAVIVPLALAPAVVGQGVAWWRSREAGGSAARHRTA